MLTPDSSRFWPADQWEPGRAQPSFDKQFVRDWLTSAGLRLGPQERAAAARRCPQEIVDATRAKYVEAYERLTGTELAVADAQAHEEGPGRRTGGFFDLERTTRFELATSTLARLRSTN